MIEALLEAGKFGVNQHAGYFAGLTASRVVLSTHHFAITIHEVRRFALALPKAAELEHWGNPSFRIRGRIFATMPDDGHLNVMLDPFDVEPVVREDPGSCEELLWGKQLVGVRVALKQAAPNMVKSLLGAAWRRKAPKRLLRSGP